MSDGGLTAAIDFDGTIVAEHDGPPFSIRPHAVDGLRVLKRAGYRLVLHSCRCNVINHGPQVDNAISTFYETGEADSRAVGQWPWFVEMRRFLQETGLWEFFDEIWQSPGKPIAAIYIDDRSVSADWAAIIRNYGGNLVKPEPLRRLGTP